MKQIPRTYGLVFHLDTLEYEQAALAADPDTAELAAPYEELIGEWPGVFQKERASRRAVTQSEAVVAVRNAQIDNLTIRAGNAAKAHDQSGSLLKRLFGALSPSRFVALGLRRQCEKTSTVLLVEIGKLDKKNPVHAFLSPIKAACDGALAALDTRNKAKGDRQTTTNDIDEWKDGVNKLRTTTYAELLKIAVEKGYAKSWADTFFRSDSAPAADDTIEPPPPAPPAAPPPA